MARAVVCNQQDVRVAVVELLFDEGSSSSYLFVDMDPNYGAMYGLHRSVVMNGAGKEIASLWCGSNGKMAHANVAPVGRSIPNLGNIVESKARVMEANGWCVLGNVVGDCVRNSNGTVVGNVSIEWGSEDEAYYQRRVQDYANQARVPIDRARELLERRRVPLYQTIMMVAGCSALILHLFEKKRGWFG